MKILTIDNSVFLKLFLEEELSDEVENLFNIIVDKKWKIINPTLFEYELYKTVIMGRCNVGDVFSYIEDLEDGTLNAVSLTLRDIEKAREIVGSSQRNDNLPSFYDAIYHAIAINNSSIFITADTKYYNKTKHIGNIVLLSKDIVSQI